MPYNTPMRHIEILLPFGLPSPQLAPDLVRELHAPASGSRIPSDRPALDGPAFATGFATLLARASIIASALPGAGGEVFTGALPHEHWLGQRFGLPAAGNLPIAPAGLQACGLGAQEGYWFIVNPVHIHIARDHLVLTDRRQLGLSDVDSRVLFDAALPYFEEAGKTLLYGDSETWFVRADDWHDLHTSTPDAASGHNIDIWMPKSSATSTSPRQWRKLQNEVQMLWHTHEINDQRQARGLQPVNSLWLWAGAAASLAMPARPFSAVYNLPGALRGLGQLNGEALTARDAGVVIAAASASGPVLVYLDQLTAPSLADDWAGWLDQITALEGLWFSPLLAALQQGRIDKLSLTLSHSTGLTTYAVSRNALRKFWAKPGFNRLLP